jgi:hypothetical protein
MKIGFSIDETMIGTHAFKSYLDEPLPMSFKATWGTDDIINNSEGMTEFDIKGTVSINGLCVDTPMEGILELKYFTDASIKYFFTFFARGVKYYYIGRKVNIKPWNIFTSHTTCFGVLVEAATYKLVSTSVTYFELSSILSFLNSFKLKLG